MPISLNFKRLMHKNKGEYIKSFWIHFFFLKSHSESNEKMPVMSLSEVVSTQWGLESGAAIY